MTPINFMSHPMVCPFSNGMALEIAETNKFMKATMADISINQAELKCAILTDKINAKDTTPAQKYALTQELNATKVELAQMKQKHNVG